MSRNRPPVIRSKDTTTRARTISQSETQSSQKVRSTECHNMPRHATEKPVSRLPKPKVLRIQQRYIAGENQTAIAKAEGCDRQTVSRIANSSEMAEYIKRMREELRRLLPDALGVIRHALQVKKDARIAYQLLRDLGVVLAAQLPNQPDLESELETGERWKREWAMRLGLIAIEKSRIYGTKLPDVEAPVAPRPPDVKV